MAANFALEKVKFPKQEIKQCMPVPNKHQAMYKQHRTRDIIFHGVCIVTQLRPCNI